MSISSSATGLRPGVCTSSTRPTSPYTGQIIYETDTGYLRVWDGANWDYLSKSQDGTTNLPISDIGKAWSTWTPTVTQTGNVTFTQTAQSYYGQIQKVVFASIYLTVTGTGTAGSHVIVSLPVTARTSFVPVGQGFIYDSSTATNYVVTSVADTTTTAYFFYTNASGNAWGVAPNVGLANNDQIRIQFMYEAA